MTLNDCGISSSKLELTTKRIVRNKNQQQLVAIYYRGKSVRKKFHPTRLHGCELNNCMKISDNHRRRANC